MASVRAGLVVNAQSRRGKRWYGQLKASLKEARLHVPEASLIGRGASVREEVGRLLQLGCDPILVGGGDGTLAEAATVLAGSGRTLGVVPMGTGNAFARDLGIRTDLAHAVSVIAEGRTQLVDIGKCEAGVFLTVASVGLTSLIAAQLKRMPKQLLGPLAYFVPAFTAVRLIRPFRIRMSMDDQTIEESAFQVVVGNGRYHAGPFVLADDAGLRTGQFVVYAVRAAGKGVLLRYALGLVRGSHPDLPEIDVWRTEKVSLETAPRKKVVLDGEIRSRTPQQMATLPRSLKVFVPASSETTR